MTERERKPPTAHMTPEAVRELRAMNRYRLHHKTDADRIRKLAAIVDEIERRLVRRIAALERRIYDLAPGPDRIPGSDKARPK